MLPPIQDVGIFFLGGKAKMQQMAGPMTMGLLVLVATQIFLHQGSRFAQLIWCVGVTSGFNFFLEFSSPKFGED